MDMDFHYVYGSIVRSASATAKPALRLLHHPLCNEENNDCLFWPSLLPQNVVTDAFGFGKFGAEVGHH
ncbi:hypothetical protein DITRI_Ditri04bG0070400 [Diplodiscus trichospermus]